MVSPLPRHECSELERDGWQLLLWSYRHELGLDEDEDEDSDAYRE
jgi:hypothetical protein